jgi:sigma-B regulation protein RsbU (phosphoserine phosphatase)
MIQAVPRRQPPDDVPEVLADFRRAHGRDAWLWARDGNGWVLAAGPTPAPPAPGPDASPVGAAEPAAWCVEVADAGGGDAAELARFLAGVLDHFLAHDEEMRLIARELYERYEEITLLYGISEILGSVISLQEAAGTILAEVAGAL